MNNKQIGYIYAICNKINGKIYIGGTINIKQRLSRHKSNLKCDRHSNEHLQNSVNKYGLENFIFERIYETNIELLDTMERVFIEFFDSTNPKYGYNKESGGKSGFKASEETIRKKSKAAKGENNPKYWLGKKIPEEARIKMSKRKNKTGIMNVFKNKTNNYKQGYRWVYQYLENGKPKWISSTTLSKLENKVKARGLPWIKIEGDKNDL